MAKAKTLSTDILIASMLYACGANEDNQVSTNKLSQCYYEDKREECYHSIIGPRPILGLHLERKICIN